MWRVQVNKGKAQMRLLRGFGRHSRRTLSGCLFMVLERFKNGDPRITHTGPSCLVAIPPSNGGRMAPSRRHEPSSEQRQVFGGKERGFLIRSKCCG